MVYAKNSYKLDSIKFNNLNICNENIEIQVVEVSKRNHKTNILLNIYRPPNGNQNEFLSTIRDTMHTLSDCRYPDIILLGDLNLDHSKGKRNDTTNSLLNSLKTHGLTQLISKPTRIAMTSSTLLDVLYVKTNRKTNPFVIQTALSDHYLVGTVLYLDYTKPETTTFEGRSFRKYSFDEAETYYRSKDTSRIYQMNDVDLIWDYLVSLVTTYMCKLTLPSKDNCYKNRTSHLDDKRNIRNNWRQRCCLFRGF